MTGIRLALTNLPPRPRVVVEVPAGGRIKRGAHGGVDYVSPWPSPFNYGSAPDHPAPDGDPADVVILGPRLARGHERVLPLRGRVLFWDAGDLDDKWICSDGPVGEDDLARLSAFFTRYARIKRWLARVRLRPGRTAFEGIELL